MSSIADRLSDLSPAKRQLLLRRLKEEAAARVEAGEQIPSLTPVERGDELPLSFAQQRLWFLDQFEPGNPFYNVAKAVRLSGPLDDDALRRSLNEVVRRHEALRTTFPAVGEKGVQVVAPSLTLELPVVSLVGLVPVERDAEVARLAAEEAASPFDLARGPLLRSSLLRLGEEEHVLLLTMHHIISDGWSMGVFIHEMGALYRAYARGEASPLAELPVQYADFAVWQREWLKDEVLDAQLAYWKRQLADISQLELPTDRPRPTVESFRGRQQTLKLSAALTESLKQFSQRHEVTLYMTLLAAFEVLLSRYTGQKDVVVGTPIANRNRAEVEGMIGFFVNTLVLRTDVSGDPTFAELLRRVREVCLSAYANQDLPFERVVEELHPERGAGFNPLFQVLFALQNVPGSMADLAGLTLDLLPVENDTAKFDLICDMQESPDGLTATFEYNTDLFDDATITRMMRHFHSLLDGATAEPSSRISGLPMLGAEERRQVLEVWNDTATEYPSGRCLGELFEEAAARTPDVVAVEFDGEELTYGELNRQANQLAHHLRECGVGPETRVGIYVERSARMIVGLLGIIKAGGAYMPLDSAYPKHWLAFMLEDGEVPLLLTQSNLLDKLPEHSARVVCLDADWEKVARHSEESPACATTPDNLAYVIYTSGSTGRPKGVCVSHGAVNRLVFNSNYVRLTPSDVVAQASNASFDAATFEIWGALLQGARLVGISKDAVLSPQVFAAQIKEKRVGTMFLTTALFNQIAREAPDAFNTMSEVLFGGEAVDVRRVREVLSAGGPRRLLHVYGPTESTTFATWHEVREAGDGDVTIPIGRPLSNTTAYVLDAWMSPAPVGVVGELYLGGDGLARGYLNRPSLTAERFAPDPFGPQGGGRLYKTGDLVRLLPGGEIEFVGRADHQVKVRGFRIELGEIETVLSAHPSVGEAVVVARESEGGDKRLVAYVVPETPAQKADETAGGVAGNVPGEQVSQWEMIFDDIYSRDAASDDSTFNVIGWNSTYTGEPIPQQEMREWLDDTVGRILSLSPRRVLEIGCGTGMLLFKVAPHCARYRGVDLSQQALDYVRQNLSGRPEESERVELSQRAADDFSGVEPEQFDTVVINSVVQYFPSISYLAGVLEQAVEALEPGGSIFVGDVRSLPLLEAFHSSMALHGADDSEPSAHLRLRAQAQMRQEEELIIDPAFFHALKQRLPKISGVEIFPKRGRALNELTQFRYQVVIRVGDPKPAKADVAWRDWQDERPGVDALRSLLEGGAHELLCFRDISNARVSAEVGLAALLSGDGCPETAGGVREVYATFAHEGLNPEEVWTLGEAAGYEVAISCARTSAADRFDAVFVRRGAAIDTASCFASLTKSAAAQPLSHYANNPLQGSIARKLVPELRTHLRERLPEYMTPASFVMMDALPLTPNGKVDRKALPAPEQVRPELGKDFVAPRKPVEEVLAGIWSKVLGIEQVGIHDNFFELGGHSLLATQVISRIRESLDVELPLRSLFESPTVAELGEAVDALIKAGHGLHARPIVRVSREQELPLSFAQQRLWFLDQLQPDNPFYNISAVTRLYGRLDMAALERTLAEIVRRHEVLRTSYEVVDGRSVQVIGPTAPFEVTVEDVSRLPESERAAEVNRLTAREVQRPFNLSESPLMRAALVRLSEEEHVLLFTTHHIVGDGWSMGVLVREVAALYNAFSKGEASPLAELPVQYADFAVWQREWLQGEVLDRQLSYWRGQLSGAPPVLELPTDRPRPAVQTYNGASHHFKLSPVLTRRLKEFSQQHEVTLYMTLLAAFKVLLSRYSGQGDVVVGTPIANRNRAETEDLIGFFVNTLVLRTRLEEGEGFDGLLRRVREVCLGAYAHQDLPFEKLVEELQPERDMSHNPLFQVMFVLQNALFETQKLRGLSLGALKVESGTAKFDITLSMSENEACLEGYIEYNTDLFEAATIERMASHFRNLLEAALADPSLRASELRMLGEAERRNILDAFNETAADYERGACLHQLFEAQAARTPHAEAVAFREVALTYEQLDGRASRLARHLQSLGVGPESLVGILLERTERMVVAVLAVHKAGGAYVPLDPAYPGERLRFMLEDSGARVLVTQESLLARDSLAVLLEGGAAAVVSLDGDAEFIASYPSSAPPSPVTADNLSHVIYTSGSTGRPKGVAITHSSSSALVAWSLSLFDYSQLRGVLASTSLCFDLSVFELFAPLSSGGSVLVADSALSLREVASRREVTMLNTVPSAMAELLRAGDVPAGLEAVNLAGEPLTKALAEGAYAAGALRVYNLYGPTEDTTYSTWELVAKGCEPTIGRPVSNTRAYVLDRGMSPAPVGVAGELYLAGEGLARGYLNRPGLTAERFVPDPFGVEGGGRLYRTGDLVRYLPDGRMEYLGRIDHQVKVRGFRIELGEVEAALQSHESVRECVVMARESEGGDKRLVAYVVTEDGAGELSAGELRAHLKGRLPEYMVPSAFVTLEAMPLTPNGKVDRRALPEPGRAESGVEQVSARNPIEDVLVGVWSRVLGVEKVGVNENFFDLGGHSLLATQLVSRIREAFGVDVPLRAVFESPTVAELAAAVETAIRAEQGFMAPPIRRVTSGENLSLSFAQERLWFIDQLEPNSPFYNCPGALHLAGNLNAEALERCLNEIVRRHETLRTTFKMVDGRPAQVVSPPQPFALAITDLSDLDESERDDEVRWLAGEEARKPFDLGRGPLLRVSLLRLAEEEHVALFTMHHIVSDGWSMGVLVKEVAALYAAYSAGVEPSLPELPVQYGDFAAWQREWLQGDVLEQQLNYWREHLSGAPPVLELPTDRPRPAVQTYQGANQSIELPKELVAGIKELSSSEGVTLYMTLLAAFEVLLSRYTGQKDIVVGTPIANRNRAETEDLIGFFVNTLVLRTDVSGDPTFAELLRRVREVCLGAYAHQDLPFEKLVEELKPERSLSHSPLFQVVFGFQNQRREILDLPGLTLSDLGVESGTAKFDLIHTVIEKEDGLVANLHYNTDLFDAETIERMLRHFRSLLEGVVADPARRIHELPLLSEQERGQLLVEWNDTAREFPVEACLHELFEAQAALTPDATAVAFEGGELSYRELNERANQLAHHLRSLGVVAETPVGLCVERSAEMVVGILGVLKAGGACVPLDPAYPPMRLAFMLEDAGVSVLLTQEPLEAALPQHGARVLRLDADWPSVETQSAANPRGVASAQNVAYVIYTSGSTGRPKGALLLHRGLVNRILAGQAAYHLAAEDRVLHKASFSFDASLWEIFWPLLVGARLVLARPGGQQDAAYLVNVIEREAVTIVHFVPSMLQVFLEEPGVGSRCLGLRRVFCGGEVLPVELAGRFFEKLPAHLHNQYGPTETSVNATYWTCVRGEEPHTIPIGRPFANVRLYVLDEFMHESPVGVAGELYIGGAGVTRGYVGRPALTAERFVPDPFGGEGGGRLYRTGDRVRYLPDGAVEFLGRLDNQVKIRGFRIEIGEVESLLAEHPSVREAVVVARADAPGAKRLVAYLIPSGEEPPTSAELRAHLKERLPEYMLPSHFVCLAEMPLSPNGKADRRALPAPEQLRVGPAEDSAGARTPVEEVLAGMWSQVLGVGRVGVNENFFELGGHSLLATQLVSRIREAFGVEVALRAVFESPTVAELAVQVESALRSGKSVEAPPVVPVPREGHLPLAFAQERLWFIDQLEPGNPVYNIGAAVRLAGRLDMDALRRTFDESIRRHESLRTTFAAVGGRPVQVVSPPGHFEIALTDLSGLPEAGRDEEARRLAGEEARKPFDLGRGPLLRVSLLRLAEEEHVALFTMHHIISDGWSMGILIREVAALYAAYSAGVEPSLPEPGLQYADYAVWQRGWLQGEALENHLAYWRNQLSGAPPLLELTTDRPRPAVQSFSGAQLAFELPAEVLGRLNDLSRLKGVTLYMTLLAAFKVLLYHYAKQPDIVVGASIANRNRAETEGLIGFFVNMLITRTDLSGDPTFRELLDRVRETALGAFTHQDVPFEKLVEELRPERDLGYNPLFQVAFVLQNAPMPTLELAGLTISPVEKEKEVSIFDLLLELTETPEGLTGLFSYSKDLWDAPTVEHMASLYRALLRGVAAEPDMRLSALVEMFDAADKRRSDDRQAGYKQVRRLRLKGINLTPFEVSQT